MSDDSGNSLSEISEAPNIPSSTILECTITILAFIAFFITLPISIFISFKVVSEYERAVIFRLGKMRSGGARGPGVFFILPCVDFFRKVDLRTVPLSIPEQEVITSDSCSISVDAILYYHVENPLFAVIQIYDFKDATWLLAAATLRNVLGRKSLSEVMTQRDVISNMMQQLLDKSADPWGIKIERVEIKEIRLPPQMQRAMAAEAEATREAKAKVIIAEGEKKAAETLKKASDVIAGDSTAIQIRYLQTLNTVSADNNTTIVFPIEMLSKMKS